MINGFYINKTGNFTATIEYKPKQWFNIGLVITILSIFAGIGYLIWKTRKIWKKLIFYKIRKTTLIRIRIRKRK